MKNTKKGNIVKKRVLESIYRSVVTHDFSLQIRLTGIIIHNHFTANSITFTECLSISNVLIYMRSFAQCISGYQQ